MYVLTDGQLSQHEHQANWESTVSNISQAVEANRRAGQQQSYRQDWPDQQPWTVRPSRLAGISRPACPGLVAREQHD
jgi:hypothetical protein